MANILEKFINIFVDAKTANAELEKTTDNLEKVDKAATEVTQSTTKLTKASQDQKKSLMENGGAMGLLGAATGGLSNDFRDAIELTEGLGISMKGLRGAIIATGIGALAIAVLELVSNWKEWKGVIDGSTAAMDKLNSEYDDLLFNKGREEALNDRALALSNARGDSEEAQYAIAIKNSVDLVKSLEEQIQLAAKLSATEYTRSGNSEEFSKLRQKETDLENAKTRAETAALALYEGEKTRIRTKAAEAAKKISDDAAALQKKNEDARMKALLEYSNTLKEINAQLSGAGLKETYRNIVALIDQYEKLNKVRKDGTAEQKAIALNTQGTLASEMRKEMQRARDKITSLNSENVSLSFQNELKLKSIVLSQKMFEFEKTVDGRLDNSNKFVEINKNINEQYENRIKLLRYTRIEQEASDADEKRRIDFRLAEAKQTRNRTQKLASINPDSSAFQGALKIQNAKVQDLELQQAEQSNKIAKNTADYKLELATEEANMLISIEQNIWEQKRMMRDEDLERERMYYDSVLAIADESANFLEALTANGHIKNKKAAEAALVLRKASGVASVVIAGQEEIRGIWANPALTALPDTGVSAKTALTVAASLKGALSIGTILAQKLGGSSSSSSSGGGNPTPQFNTVGSSSTNQLAATIASQQKQPIKAYVVGTEMTTQQQLDRNAVSNGTFIALLPFLFFLLSF